MKNRRSRGSEAFSVVVVGGFHRVVGNLTVGGMCKVGDKKFKQIVDRRQGTGWKRLVWRFCPATVARQGNVREVVRGL